MELVTIRLKLVLITAVLLLALISDLRTYKIKNSITFSFMAVGITSNAITDGISGILLSAQGILLPFVFLVLLYAMRILGAGDIKLFCAVGAIMGAGFALHAAAYSFICGGVIAAALVLTRKNGADRFKYLFTYMKCCVISMEVLQYTDFEDRQDSSKFHFSIAAAAGTIAAAFLNTPIA